MRTSSGSGSLFPGPEPVSTGREIQLPETVAQSVLLVRAVEEADRSGRILPLAERRGATARARSEDAAPGEAGWLSRRARDLLATLEREVPSLPRLLRLTNPVRGLTWPAVAVAFVLGLATNALGPEKRLNVLAIPLLGLIAWNLLVLAFLAVRAWLPIASPQRRVPGFVGRLEALARRWIERWPRSSGDDARREDLRRALGQYLGSWLPVVAPLAAARGRRLLHAASLALILGVVAGMYLRGIAFQYQATWESTFLSGGTVDRLLAVVLAPAAAVLGETVPRASVIESPRAGDAASWIHLWAVTAALWVALPRALLLTVEGWRCARLGRRLALILPGAYLRRLVASIDTSERRLEVMPYSYRPSSSSTDRLKQLLLDLFGPRSEIRVGAPLDYGVVSESLEPGRGRLRIVLFGLAQTPEVEVHGELLRQLQEDLPDGQALVAMVDAGTYRQRLEGVAGLEDRLAQRRRAWDRVIRDSGLEAVQVDLSQPLAEDALSRLVESAWPAGALSELD